MKGPKAILLEFAVLAFSISSFSQGFIYGNRGVNAGAFAPIYGPDPGAPYLQKWGNTSESTPPGTQTYSGAPLAGSNYSVQAFYSLTPVQNINEMVLNAPFVVGSLTTFRTGLAAGFFGPAE